MFEHLTRLPAYEKHLYFKDMCDFYDNDIQKDERACLWERSWDITFNVISRSAAFGVVRRGLHIGVGNTRKTLGVIPSLDDSIIKTYLDHQGKLCV